ncbi:putative transposase [Shigella flexneri K-315]|uniref:Putative transposase n=1 Tax=Shigella flexneri K-315 TaxID=766150 RepID=I6CMF6_SHIFL|nr:putative transposase [Shigella flexneri K-315]
MPCFTAMRAEIALMSGSAFAVTHHAFSSGAGRTSDGNGSHASTLKSPSYTKSVSWQHYPFVDACQPQIYHSPDICLFYVKSIYVKSHIIVVKKVELDRRNGYI